MSATLRDWLKEEPFSLALSAGFFGFFAHSGVLTVVEEEGLLPQQLYGASAGAMVTGFWASGLGLDTLRHELFTLKRSAFWDPWPGQGLLRGRLFKENLDRILQHRRLEDCQVPAAISVFDMKERATVVLRTGDLATAIQASCALPVMFHPVKIGDRNYLDGGILDRPGLAGTVPGERVFYHHLASRSPWNRPGSPRIQVPKRRNTATLLIENITRVHPFALERGVKAYDDAARSFRAALAQPVDDGVARVVA